MSKVEFEFPVVGATPPPTGDVFEEVIRNYRALGQSLVAMGEEGPECHDQNEIAEFVVGLTFTILKHGAKSAATYSYVRHTAADKEFLIDLAARIIVLYDAETRKRNNVQEVKNVRDAISGV